MANDISSNINALNARRYMDINSSKLSKANAQLASGLVVSDPSENPAGAALGSLFATNIGVEQQAAANVTQASALIQLATGSLTSINSILSTMKQRATQANSDTISDAARSMLDKEYQNLLAQIDTTATTTKWNGVSLFAGGTGSLTRLGTVDAVGASSTFTAADISSDITLAGLVSGAVQSVDVSSTGSDSANVTIKVGGQSFAGTMKYGSQDNLVLTSQADSASSISLTISGSGIASAADLKNELRTLFGFDGGTPISLSSASTSLASSITSITPGAATAGKMYSLSFGFDSVSGKIEYKLSDGVTVDTKSFDAFTANDATQLAAARTIVFDNGVKIETAANNNEQAPIAGYELLNIVGGTHTTMSFQIGSDVNTSMSLEFKGTTTSLLGLNGTSLLTTGKAATASTLIDTALVEINGMVADFGGKKSQLNFQGQALNLQIQNETAAKASFTDADVAASLQDSTQYQALTTMASSVFGNILQEPGKLASLVQQTLR